MSSGPTTPNLILCGAEGSAIGPLRERLSLQPGIRFVGPAEAERLERAAGSFLAQDSWFALGPDATASRSPATDEAAAVRYLAWRPRRFMDLALVQWTVLRNLPRAKLLFCVRHPIDLVGLRYVALGSEAPATLEEAIDECQAIMARYARWEARGRWENFFGRAEPLSLMLEGGVYATPLARSRRLLPPEQIHFVAYEEFLAGPQRVLDGVWEFLGLSRAEAADPASEIVEAEGPEMSPDARSRLAEFYAEHNARLGELLDGLPAAWA